MILDTADIVSTNARIALVNLTLSRLVCGTFQPYAVDSCYTGHRLWIGAELVGEFGRSISDLLLTLLVARRGVLHPKQVMVFTANFMSPPTVGVAICIVRVWSPDTTLHNDERYSTKICSSHQHREDAFSPRIGSKILMRGFDSWFSR